MPLLELIDADRALTRWPFYIYRRVQMLGGKNYFFFPIDRGYQYWFREIRAKWPEVDAAGVVFAPEIFIEIDESSYHRVHQNSPVPLRLITSPSSNGVQINAAGEMTATGPRMSKKLNEMRPTQDNIMITLSGQNATPFPAFVDVMIMGYMIPDTYYPEWEGTNDA